jgi:hypothetical protein
MEHLVKPRAYPCFLAGLPSLWKQRPTIFQVFDSAELILTAWSKGMLSMGMLLYSCNGGAAVETVKKNVSSFTMGFWVWAQPRT